MVEIEAIPIGIAGWQRVLTLNGFIGTPVAPLNNID